MFVSDKIYFIVPEEKCVLGSIVTYSYIQKTIRYTQYKYIFSICTDTIKYMIVLLVHTVYIIPKIIEIIAYLTE